jgi:S1-C subfamily serine protease
MALRHLQANDLWTGMLYTEGTERYAVVSWGSSCAVSASGYLVTANHVVSGGERYIVGGWEDAKKLVQVDVVRRDEKSDLAVIKVNPPNQIAWISSEFVETGQLQEGMEAFIWGYLAVPGGFMQFLRHGVISNNTPLGAEDRMVYVETTASFGSSGSPAFLANGKPIGIVTSAVTLPGGVPLPAGVAGVIPGEMVNKILRDTGVLPATQTSLTQQGGREVDVRQAKE